MRFTHIRYYASLCVNEGTWSECFVSICKYVTYTYIRHECTFWLLISTLDMNAHFGYKECQFHNKLSRAMDQIKSKPIGCRHITVYIDLCVNAFASIYLIQTCISPNHQRNAYKCACIINKRIMHTYPYVLFMCVCVYIPIYKVGML